MNNTLTVLNPNAVTFNSNNKKRSSDDITKTSNETTTTTTTANINDVIDVSETAAGIVYDKKGSSGSRKQSASAKCTQSSTATMEEDEFGSFPEDMDFTIVDEAVNKRRKLISSSSSYDDNDGSMIPTSSSSSISNNDNDAPYNNGKLNIIANTTTSSTTTSSTTTTVPCPECGNTFGRQCNMYKHFQNIHKKKYYEMALVMNVAFLPYGFRRKQCQKRIDSI